MTYPRNTTTWPIGSLVIHVGDDKQPYMLMRVHGYTKDGLCKTRYVYGNNGHQRKLWLNDVAYLLDPKDFGIEIGVKA